MNHYKQLSRSVHQHEDRGELTRSLFDRLAMLAIIFGALTTLGSLVQISRYGLKPNIVIDFTTYLLVVIILLLRGVLPKTVYPLLALCIITACGISEFFFNGLITPNLTILSSCCVVIGALFGYRFGLYTLLACTAAVSLAAVLFTSGILTSIRDLDGYLAAPQSWFAQLTGFFTFALAGLTVVHFIQQQLWHSLGELKMQSEELQSSEKKYRLLTDNMRDVLLLLDLELRITYISPSAAKIFGCTPEELLMTKITRLTTRRNSTRLSKVFTGYISHSGHTHPEPFEFEFQRNDNSEFIAEFSPSLIRDAKGNITGIQGILRDISQRKKVERENELLEQQLRHSEKMEVIGKLAGGIAHDFNNQLAGIMGFAECITSDHEKHSETWESARSIIEITKRTADLTDKLLAFARKGNYLLETVDMHVIIDEVCSILSRSIDRSITISHDLSASPSCVKGDPGQIQNALLNIALNARDAMPAGGSLHFATSIRHVETGYSTPFQTAVNPGRYIHIVIRDTGAGIDPGTLKHIFEPFFTSKERGKGTGMGLAAVYGTIEAHHGIIDVSSTVNKGTAFHIYLPATDEKSSRPETTQLPLIDHGTGTILIIEDETTVSRMIRMVLGKMGYRTEACLDGTEAVACYRERNGDFDAVILDLILPGKSGKEVFRELRSINGSAKILICSGYSADRDVRILLRDENTSFIQKPFTMAELSHHISILLSH